MIPAVAAFAVVLQTPYVAQEKNGCGAAVAAMIVQYWNGAADAAAIHRSLYRAEARGTFASDLERYLQGQGYRTFAMRGEWSDLEEHIAKGRPLIVALKPARGALHYVVVTGIDDGVAIVHDPAQRQYLKQRRAEFENQWKAAGAWLLLALPAQ